VADDIEIHYHAGHGVLSLSCGDEAFARVRDAVIAAADLGGAIEGVPVGVRAIMVDQIRPAKPVSKLSDRLALCGCALVTVVVGTVLAVGLGTIVGWLR
jgi:hypothetical protein